MQDILITNFCWCYNPPSNDKIWGSFVKLSGGVPQHFVFWGKRNSKGQQKINILPQTEQQVTKKYRSKIEKSNPADKLYRDMCVDLKTQLVDFFTQQFGKKNVFNIRADDTYPIYHLIHSYANLTESSRTSQNYYTRWMYSHVVKGELSAEKYLPTAEQKQKTWQAFVDLYQTNLTNINELYNGFEDEILNELLIYTLEN